jgi:NhaP-type Na+/H+ or K+/H+ antiporter
MFAQGLLLGIAIGLFIGWLITRVLLWYTRNH